LAALIEQATTQTAATVQSTTAKRQYVYGSYVDEVLSYTNNGTRYFTHNNHLYSPSAITNAAGQVQERYRYDAYGKQTITTATGTVRNQSAVGFSRGFTGYILDEETGLYYARSRMYDSRLGRFIERDLLGYIDGPSLYQGYFVSNGLDPYGLAQQDFELNLRFEDTDVLWGEASYIGTDVVASKVLEYTKDYWNSYLCCCETTAYKDMWELRQKKYWREKYSYTYWLNVIIRVQANPDAIADLGTFLGRSGAGFIPGPVGATVNVAGLISAWLGDIDIDSMEIISKALSKSRNDLGGEYEYGSAFWDIATGSSAINIGCNSKGKAECGLDNPTKDPRP